VLLWAWLTEHNLTAFPKLVQLDVHTGLGPTGLDTLLVDGPAAGFPPPAALFAGAYAVEGGDAGSGDVGLGYEATVGFSSESCSHFFRAGATLCLTQEFGTVPGIFVALAMIHENAAFN
jgi:hypothetical protein